MDKATDLVLGIYPTPPHIRPPVRMQLVKIPPARRPPVKGPLTKTPSTHKATKPRHAIKHLGHKANWLEGQKMLRLMVQLTIVLFSFHR